MSRVSTPARKLKIMIHQKCRGIYYPNTGNTVKRFPVPDDKVKWDVRFDDYKPVKYTDKSLLGKPYADLEIGHPNFQPLWNLIDGPVNRASFSSVYQIVQEYPQNIGGRTGIVGRGCLGRWGPNHAADPIVTRWKRKSNGDIEHHVASGEPILQFVGIQRKDCGEWAIPGGMVDPFEIVTTTLKREFMEEALNSLEFVPSDREIIQKSIDKFFSGGTTIYEGYVDDPRNTDNAWMETVAMNFHDSTGDTVGFDLNAGDDAAKVRWIDISKELVLYASHIDFISAVAHERKAHW